MQFDCVFENTFVAFDERGPQTSCLPQCERGIKDTAWPLELCNAVAIKLAAQLSQRHKQCLDALPSRVKLCLLGVTVDRLLPHQVVACTAAPRGL